MEYRRLGKSGLQVSAFSFGSWLTFGLQMKNKTAEDCMKLAYDNGINLFDNAEGYADGKSEEVMGNILKKFKWSRSSYLVSSKVYFGTEDGKPNQKGLSRKHVIEACNAALNRLKVDYLDMYFCHRPDKSTPTEETVWAIHQLFLQGKILYWGTSEWSAQQITEAYQIAERHHLLPPSMEQPQYNMFARERLEKEYVRLFSVYGMGTTIWSPLASGLLTGKYNNGFVPGTRISMEKMEWLKDKTLMEEKIRKANKLTKLAKDAGIRLNHLALCWCLKNPNVSTVILGASKVEQLADNLKALNYMAELTPELLQQVEEILQNKPKLPQS